MGICLILAGSKCLPGWFGTLFRKRIWGVSRALQKGEKGPKKCLTVPVWVRGAGPIAIWAMPKWKWIFLMGLPLKRMRLLIADCVDRSQLVRKVLHSVALFVSLVTFFAVITFLFLSMDEEIKASATPSFWHRVLAMAFGYVCIVCIACGIISQL